MTTESHEAIHEVRAPRRFISNASASVQAGVAMQAMLIQAKGKPRVEWSSDARHIWSELDAILRGGS